MVVRILAQDMAKWW